ncbi:efflux RND transporter periplasmic adaptor subunit [Devosia sp. FKR38]|uniref:efflux RND transporter periplasmic adaptor subunit n=1 Tax=Devosia sp. FKR38 TaxID=2562312 RepID=UPI0010C07E17|nr:efflux RND transporter periplasmic adaptor subunit [Devosia sp. FKR38]
MKAPFPAALAILASLALAGCQPAAEKPEPIRPVLAKVLALESAPVVRFAGEVAPRYQTDLSFQIFGRVIERSVDVGDTVSAGQQIAQLDSTSQQLTIRSAEANLAAAEAQLNNLLAVEQRQGDLLERGTISDTVYETAQQASRSGEAAVAQARAQLEKAQEQLAYTTLRADTDAVVTAVGVEPGQTVGVGQMVATVVRPEEREAVIFVPEAFAARLAVGDRFDIVKQLDPAIAAIGTVREIAPQANANTRSFQVRIALNGASVSFTMGSTITASLAQAETDQLVLPRTAIVDRDGAASAWVVDPDSHAVSLHSVMIADRDATTVEVTSGLSVGDVVVVAGVHSLEDGQTVRIDEGQK